MLGVRFLVCFADPMRSWCYGFEPELSAFPRDHAGLAVEEGIHGINAKGM